MRNILILSLLIFFGGSSMAFADQLIKQPNVSGQFYTAEPKRLSAEIDKFIERAEVSPLGRHVDIVIAPHAGYMYSGAVAAYGFKAVSRYSYKTVVILAPSHYFGFNGIAVWPKGGFQTPLGVVEVDEEFAARLTAEDEKFRPAPQAFEQEHSLEVEIPFLQKTLKDFKIVPVIMGQPDFALLEKLAVSLNKIVGRRQDVLMVVSTDLSHYHDDAKAKQMDRRAIDAVKKLDAAALWEGCRLRTAMEMCGYVPVTVALLYARERGLKTVEALRHATSGDVTGDRDRVVGYTSIIIYGSEPALPRQSAEDSFTEEQKKRLLAIARDTIYEYVQNGKILDVRETDPRLMKEEGAFVTIHKSGNLRGCIGNILGQGPLYLTVRDMAISSAAKDPRFSPVTKEELADLDVEVSVLSKPRVIRSVEEITLGRHGVIVSQGLFHHGVFLPQVASETGWTKEVFLSQLCAQKAGLPADAWKDPKTKIEIFTAEVFSEKDFPQ